MTHHADRLWVRPSPLDRQGPAAWDGQPVGDDVRLEIWLGPLNAIGARYFRCFLTADLGRLAEPVAYGLQHAGALPGHNWVEVLAWQHLLALEDGRTIGVPPAIELRIFEQFATLVPLGGHFMAEYESPARDMTARALAAKVPPIATPLGWLLHLAGCGDAYRDWYTPEGGREGPRKLQGFRATSEEHAQMRGREMLEVLRAFMAGAADLDWDVQAQTRPLAEAAIDDLSERYE